MFTDLAFKRLRVLSLLLFSSAALVSCGGGGEGDAATGGPSAASAKLMASESSPLPGAIWTSLADCVTTNGNTKYDTKLDVYLNGGSAHAGAAGLLPNTSYHVQVTTPSGATVLGSSGADKPVTTNAQGNFAVCYKLWDIVLKGSDGTQGYDDTTNHGGEYKVWVSTVANFEHQSTKTDNFKVLHQCTTNCTGNGSVTIKKWYDANANGVWDDGEPKLPGWKVDLTGFDPKSTTALFTDVPLDDVNAREFTPVQTNWYATNAYVNTHAQNTVSSNLIVLNQINVPLSGSMTTAVVKFGNVCTGAGGGHTLGFWSNKNGQALVTAGALAMLRDLNLRKEDGTDFDPATATQLRQWLLGGRSVNMAYMLSVQLAAMELGVFTGQVNGSSLVYAPGALGANGAGFMTVSDLMDEANASLGDDPVTRAGMTKRAYQDMLKTALDQANNNLTFVQPQPCAFSFEPPVVLVQ